MGEAGNEVCIKKRGTKVQKIGHEGPSMSDDLTRADVARLLSDPSPRSRAETAAKVAGQMAGNTLSPEEMRLAQDIVEAMARDASAVVREALAINLKSSRKLPRDMALMLARDIDQVALPILEFSEVLTDADLVELIRPAKEDRQMAIARRREVSGARADALLATEHVRVGTELVGKAPADPT